MPCTYYTPEEESRIAISELNKVEAMLCAVLSVAKFKHRQQHLDETLIENIDEKEAGVTKKELSDWWIAHQEKDRARRRAEQAAEQKRLVKAAALSKLQKALTPEELKSLGIHRTL